MEKILDINYFSQNAETVSEKWHNSGCGIACLKMILDSKGDSASINDLASEGVALGGYTDDGWVHQALVTILRNHNISSYRQEFRSKTFNKDTDDFSDNPKEEELVKSGFNKMKESVDKENAVIASVDIGFSTNKSTHLILIVGYKAENEEITGFYYHDPDTRDGVDKSQKFVNIDEFRKYWRQLAILTD
jgi:hypothetical protein